MARRADDEETRVDGEQIRTLDEFRFPSYAFDPATGVATFDYLLRGAAGELTFTETVEFPLPATPADPATLTAVRRVLDLLHVVAGVSYHKLSAARRIVLDTPVTDEARALFDAVYSAGLAEYAYRNDLPHVLAATVQALHRARPPRPVDVADRRPLSAVGGGKDSIVTLEALRHAGLDPVPFAVNPNWVIDSVNAASGLAPLAARRRIDPALFAANRAGGYNGHIPVTAINSLIAVATAVWHGLGPVVMSNERSASDPNLVWHGHPVNHQWSKGIEAEGLLRAALAGHAGLADAYFSLLRQLSELDIARLFAGVTAYDSVVTSCNAAFKLHDPSARWCGHCPKCRFVFLAMAPFMARERLTGIFGADLLDDPAQVPGYLQLLGLDGHKPFECVGEVEESVVALVLLAEHPQWRSSAVVTALLAAVPGSARAAASRATVLTPAGPHHVPPAYAKALAALAS